MPAARAVLAVDVGTTAVRAAVVDAAGDLVAEEAEPCPPQFPLPGRAEADPDAWWNAACAVVRRLGQRSPADRIEAVAVTGQAPTAVLVDGAGRPLGPAILWLDMRAHEEARDLAAALGPERARALSGNRIHPYFLGPKIAWLRRHEPERLEHAQNILQSHAYLVMRLTGEARSEASTAMLCAPLFDAKACRWSSEAAGAVGVDEGKLPPVARSDEVIGRVTREAAAQSGLREGTPVVTGGGDFAASALGAAVIDEGEACLMLGSSGNLLMPMNQPRFDDRLINSHHVGCRRWLSLGATLCGAALEWFRRTCAVDADWETLEREAADVAAGADGVLLLPYFRGERTPVWDEDARGVFFGLDLAHGRAHLYRALVEGIALGFRHNLAVAEESGAAVHEVVAVNGAGRSALLRQTLSDALGVPLTWAPSGGGTVIGGAALAAIGSGVIADARAVRGWRAAQRSYGPGAVRHVPRAREHALLQDAFARRTALYAALKGVRSSA